MKCRLGLLVLFLTITFVFSGITSSQISRTTIFIRSDGSVYPPTVSIQRDGDVYTLTDNVYDPILFQRSNITLDGVGYSLIGPLTEEQKEAEQVLGLGPDTTITIPYIIGVDFEKNVTGVEIKNLNINHFSIGVYLRTSNNTLIGNAVTDNIVGVLLSSSSNSITRNYIRNNKQGLFFGFERVNGSEASIPSDIIISENSFLNNIMQLSGCVCKIYNFSEARHAWDYNNKGNYWSDYNGTDSSNDGVGDTYYIIDPLNYDRYPLVVSPAQPPALQTDLSTEVVIPIVVLIIMIIIVVMLLMRKRRA